MTSRKSVPDERVASWSQLMDRLYADAWTPTIRRFRPPVAFRGMADASFLLNTSLMRLGNGYTCSEGHLLRNFRKYAVGRVPHHESFWYWLAIAQHHGLPTRLLDWTFSPFVALHFVTASTELYDRDGVIWCIDYKKVHQQVPESLRVLLDSEGADVFTVDMLNQIQSLPDFDTLAREPFALFFDPPSIDERIVNQYAMFSIVSDARVGLGQWLEERPTMYRKLIIPAELKWEIRDKLDQANINERVLFPGLDGLSQWLRRQYIQLD
ncbi:hypothetical protein GGR92_000187 [Spirosoma lacussanchae]|uniref:FRG domain-containing protein n=1 Tax=Spirosoma lacussanchae TaxID=1884249 RepID=UPI001109EBDD|nr:FRG domain-containing protein [Spirosoma lacussanchae]